MYFNPPLCSLLLLWYDMQLIVLYLFCLYLFIPVYTCLRCAGNIFCFCVAAIDAADSHLYIARINAHLYIARINADMQRIYIYTEVTLFERFIQLGKHVKIAINISITGAFG